MGVRNQEENLAKLGRGAFDAIRPTKRDPEHRTRDFRGLFL